MPVRMAVFDLDFTLWDCGGTWCDCTRPPYRREGDRVFDSRDAEIVLYPSVRDILEFCREKGLVLALASRTEEPSWALELIGLLGIGHYFSHREIYPGSKIAHLKRISRHSGIPCGEMVFFDDEMRNIRDTSSLGVQAFYVDRGMNWVILNKALFRETLS